MPLTFEATSRPTLAVALAVLATLATACSSVESSGDDCVVLLHGMGRTDYSMSSMEDHFQQAGFRTVNVDYPSTSMPIEQIAERFVPDALEKCGDEPTHTHFVTHSLGGIIVRYYLQTHELPTGSRVVMLSPPNKGSEIADRFKDSAWYRWLTGPPGQQLGTDADSMPARLGPVNVEVGVITGRDTLEPWFSRLIPGDDDGKVSVESARLDEMTDFLVVDHGHTFIMQSDEVMRSAERFLRTGRFDAAQADR